MDKPKWTPGPWKWKYDSKYGKHIIMMGTRLKSSRRYQSHHEIEHNHCIYPEDGPQFLEAEANIRLMCSAPELYKALKAIIKANDEYDGDILNEIEDAREVLVKAEGREVK